MSISHQPWFLSHPSVSTVLTGSPFRPDSPERPGIPGSPYSGQERGRAVSPSPLNAHPKAEEGTP